jgi:type IV pilus assembly protein PilF
MDPHRGKRFAVSGLLLALLTVGSAGSAMAGSAVDASRFRTELAVEYLRQDNLREALASAETAVQEDPANVAAYLVHAHILQLLKLDGRAEQSFKKALQLAPDGPEANNNYGWFLCTRNRMAEALPHFAKALADPLYDTPQIAQANWGMCLAKLGRDEEANEHLLAALKAAPDYPLALKELARLQLEQGNARLASFYFQRLLRVAQLATPEDLMLGVRVAHAAGDQSLETLLSDRLKQRFPDSKETQQLLMGS